MWSDSFAIRNICRVTIEVWCAIIVVCNGRVKSTGTCDSRGKLCESGTFCSDFIGGGACAPCPEPVYCKNEQLGDDRRCKEACGNLKVLLKVTIPSVTTASKKPTASPTKNHGTRSRINFGTDLTTGSISEIKPALDGRKAQRSTMEREEKSWQDDSKIIVIGLCCSIAAMLVLVILIVRCYRCQKKGQSRPREKADIQYPLQTVAVCIERNDEVSETSPVGIQTDVAGEETQPSPVVDVKSSTQSMDVLDELKVTTL